MNAHAKSAHIQIKSEVVSNVHKWQKDKWLDYEKKSNDLSVFAINACACYNLQEHFSINAYDYLANAKEQVWLWKSMKIALVQNINRII